LRHALNHKEEQVMSETYDGQDWIEAAKRMIREWENEQHKR